MWNRVHTQSVGDAVALRALDESLLDQLMDLECRNLPNPWPRILMISEFEKKISRTTGAFINDKLAGYLFAHVITDECHILNLCVDEPFRRKGIGTLMLNQVLDEAREAGVSRAWLEVRESNSAARELYKGLGFKEHSIRKAYYSDNRENAVVLELNLSEPKIS